VRPPKLTDDDIEAAKAMLANLDIGVTQIAHRLGVSLATLYVSLRRRPPCDRPDEHAGCWLGTGASNSARSMSYPTAELLGRVERRRRFSVEQKLAILTEATAPGANLSAVARRHGLLPAQVYKWRRLAELGVIGVPGASELPSFVAVEITKDVLSLPAPVLEDKPAAADDAPRRRRRKKAGLIEIELENGRRVWVDRDVDAAALERVLDVLARR
jgi:transposase